jgi:hypothetical protein
MLFSAGFAIERTTRPYAVPLGASHPPADKSVRSRLRAVMQKTMAGRLGVPHSAALARPRV